MLQFCWSFDLWPWKPPYSEQQPPLSHIYPTQAMFVSESRPFTKQLLAFVWRRS